MDFLGVFLSAHIRITKEPGKGGVSLWGRNLITYQLYLNRNCMAI